MIKHLRHFQSSSYMLTYTCRGVDDEKVTEGNGGIFQSDKIITTVANRRKFKHVNGDWKNTTAVRGILRPHV
jgi:hypothetical protein